MVWEFPTKGNILDDTRICKYKKETMRENLSVLGKKGAREWLQRATFKFNFIIPSSLHIILIYKDPFSSG